MFVQITIRPLNSPLSFWRKCLETSRFSTCNFFALTPFDFRRQFSEKITTLRGVTFDKKKKDVKNPRGKWNQFIFWRKLIIAFRRKLRGSNPTIIKLLYIVSSGGRASWPFFSPSPSALPPLTLLPVWSNRKRRRYNSALKFS